MPGEFFQSERGQIKAVEAQAQKEKKEKVSTELQAKKDLLHTEVGKAGKLLADADTKLSVPASKEKVAAYKSDITGTLKEIINSGQQALKAENPDADLAVIDLLAGSLKSTLNTVKEYVPLFNDVEAAKGQVPMIEEKLKIARDAKEKKGLRSPEFNAAMCNAEALILKAQESEIYLWKPESLPPDMKAILMSVLAPLKDQEAEIAGYRLELTDKSSLEDDPNDPPEAKEHKAAMKILKPAKAAFDTAQVNMKKISDAVKDSEKKPESLDGISGTIDTSITDLGEVLKQLKTIDKTKIIVGEYVTLYDNTLQKVNLQLQELANLKVSLKTRELMTKGLTDEEKKYVTMDEKGNITKTPEFAKLPKDKQMALEAKFKLIEIEVGMELDEKTAGEKEKKMIEGRKKLMAGDPFGAKEDLLAYYNQEAKNTERDPVRFEQTKEMLKQIAKMELSQMVQRLALMKASVKERYNNNVVGKTDFGTQTYQQAYDNIDNMARVIDAAEELIEDGKCVTIEGAEARLRKFSFPDNTVVSIQSADKNVAEIKQKGEEELKKGKEERLRKEKETAERLQKSIKGLESGEIQTTIDGQPVTAEYIEKLKAELRLQQEKTSKVEGMSLEDERAAELEPAQRDLKRAKLDQALKSWKAGFPVDISSNSWEVFDMFVQQRKLNDADPEVRKQAMLEEAQKARERGFTGLARQMYESYFAKQLQEGAKSVDKNAVREKTLKNPDVSKKLDQSLTTWKSDFKKQWGRDPEDTEIEEARGKMQNMVVSEAYNKEVKLSTYNMLEGASGPEAAEWKKIYGGTVAIENFGQGGVLTAFWTDEEWNALPVKVGVFTAVTIASGGLGSAAVAGTGMAARAVLGEIIVGRVLATAGGRALAWAGSAAVEGAVFSAAQYEFNNMLLGNGYERFSAEYWKAMGHSIVTMGVLKGVGAGVGKLRSFAEAGNAGTFIEGGLTSVAKDAAWWAGKTAIEGGSLVGLDAGMAFLSGRHFTAKEAAKSFGENFIFSAAMGGVHEFMGQGAHEAPKEKKPGEPEISKDKKPDTKPEAKPEVKTDTKPESKPETKSEPPKPPEKSPEPEPQVGQRVELVSPLDGTVETFIVKGVDANGKVILKMESGGVTRTLENMSALKSEIAKANAQKEGAPPAEKMYYKLASGEVKLDLNNPEHVQALKQKMAPEDFAVLQANPSVSPEIQASMLRGGVDLTQTSVNEKGEPVTKTIRTYGGRELGQGAYGVVVEVSYVEKGSTQLKSGVMKNPHNTQEAMENFAHEGSAAKAILDLQTQYPEQGAQHLIRPVFVSDKAIVYEKAMDKNGKTSNLEKAITELSSRDWLLQFAGGLKGLAYMQSHGISHNDVKPGNIVIGPEGGILIDVGSKVSISDINSGKVQIRGHSANGAPLPHYVTPGKNGGEKADWVGQDPKYNNGYLLAESVKGNLPLDVGDKFAVGNSIRFFLQGKGMMDANGFLVPNAPIGAHYLYNTMHALLTANSHPYEYIGNNPANGKDPYYVSHDQLPYIIEQTALTFP